MKRTLKLLTALLLAPLVLLDAAELKELKAALSQISETQRLRK